MSTISCKINNQEITCEAGVTILEAAREAGIHIPTLCYMKNLNKPAACRICIVEIEGMPRLMPSCVTQVKENMVIYTESEKVIASRKRTLDLICKRHRMDCEYCPDYTFCELHARIRELGLDERKYSEVYQERCADESSPCIVRDSSKCIRCRRCVAACKAQGVEAISALFRADKTITGAQVPMAETNCIGCGQCVKNCPTGALFIKDETDLLWRAANNKKRIVFGITQQSAENIGMFFGEKEAKNQMGKLAGICGQIGADAVYDLTGIEQQSLPAAAAKAVHRLEQGEENLMISFCPAAKRHYSGNTKLVEAAAAEELFAAKVIDAYSQRGVSREELFLVYVSPCASIKQKHRCDAVLTTTELFQWIQRACVSRYTTLEVWKNTEPVNAKKLEDTEALYKSYNDGLQILLREHLGREVTVVHADGITACEKLNAEAHTDVIWLTACPGGCENGGGQFRTQGYRK